MKSFAQIGAGCLVLLTLGSASPAAYAQRLRSPWDGQAVTMTDAPYTCPQPPAFAKSLNAESYYTDEHHSIIDPVKQKAFRDATEAPTHLGEWAGQAADAYRTTGSRAGASCVYALLEAAAKAQAWSAAMPTGQGSYEQKWLLAGVAMAYLKVRDSGVGTADQDKAIQKWLGSLANRATTLRGSAATPTATRGTTMATGRDSPWRRQELRSRTRPISAGAWTLTRLGWATSGPMARCRASWIAPAWRCTITCMRWLRW